MSTKLPAATEDKDEGLDPRFYRLASEMLDPYPAANKYRARSFLAVAIQREAKKTLALILGDGR
jgi:hypothetical protein